MRYLIGLLLFSSLIVLGEGAAPAAVVDPGAIEVGGGEFLDLLMKSIGGFKGLGILGIVGLVSKIFMKAAQTSLLGSLAGRWRLMVIYGMSTIGGVAGLVAGVDGMSLGAALLHANSLAMYSVFGNQAYKQFFEKKD